MLTVGAENNLLLNLNIFQLFLILESASQFHHPNQSQNQSDKPKYLLLLAFIIKIFMVLHKYLPKHLKKIKKIFENAVNHVFKMRQQTKKSKQKHTPKLYQASLQIIIEISQQILTLFFLRNRKTKFSLFFKVFDIFTSFKCSFHIICFEKMVKYKKLITMITMIYKIIVLLLLSTISTTQDQQIPIVNFQGSFDSMDPFRRDQIPEGILSDQTQQEKEDLNMLQFSQTLGDFVPDQTFTIRLLPYEKTSFFLWPGADVQRLRGMFHCQVSINTHQVYDDGQYLDLNFTDQQKVLRQYKHQRLGVFNHLHTQKDHKYFFHFSNYKVPIDIYFSYEKIEVNPKKTNKDSNETQLSKVSRGFTKVSKLLDEQEREMLRLIDIGDRHTQRVRNHLKELYWRGIAQGIVLVGSALTSLWMLRRQIYSQYQSLV